MIWFGRYKFILICLVLVIFAGLFLYVFTRPKATTEIMAWIYPGPPACNASAEYSDGRMVDVIKPEYFNVDQTGSLVTITDQKDGCNGFSAANLTDIKKYSKEQYVTVANYNFDGLNIFLQRSAGDQTDINSLVSFAVQNDVTGIEIDFENFNDWNAGFYLQYKNFLSKLADALHKVNKKLMVDGPAISNAEQNLYVFKYKDLAKLPIDKMVVLAYDYQFDNGAGEPISPTNWLKDIISNTKKNFPAGKLTVGIPSYGYMGVFGTDQIKLLTFDQIKNEPGFSTAVRDPNSFEMTWTDGNNVYFYNDSQSMSDNLAVAEKLGIHSVSVWHLGGNPWFLQQATSTKNK